MDFVGTVNSMNEDWSKIGQLVGHVVDPTKVMQGRSFPRRFNVTAVSKAVQQRVCQLLALDYCCLNFPLPEVCAQENFPEDHPGVSCKWVERPELATQNNLNSTWFVEPTAHRLEPVIGR